MKVYVVEYGAYSDRFTDSVFTTRELAETYIIERARRDSRVPFVERGDLSFEEWQSKNDPEYDGDVGDIDEFDLWDVVPILDKDGSLVVPSVPSPPEDET